MPDNNVTMTQAQFAELMTKVALIQQDTQFMRAEAATQRDLIKALQDQVHAIQVERAKEEATVKGRAQMAKWIWTGVTVASGAIGSIIGLTVNTYTKVGAPHP